MPDSEAVKLYRDIFRLTPNIGRREDIEKTVTDLKLWQEVLENWGYTKDGKWHHFNPLSIGKMLSHYEYLQEQQPRRPASNEESIRPEHLSGDG